MTNGQAQCRDEAASHHLPTAAAVFFLLHPSAGEGLRYITSMRIKVSSDWLPSYIMTTRPVLEIFKITGYFPDTPRKCSTLTRKPEEAIWKTQRYTVAYPGILFGGGGSKNSIEDRGQRELGSVGGSPLVRGSGGSCNIVQEITFHILKFY